MSFEIPSYPQSQTVKILVSIRDSRLGIVLTRFLQDAHDLSETIFCLGPMLKPELQRTMIPTHP